MSHAEATPKPRRAQHTKQGGKGGSNSKGGHNAHQAAKPNGGVPKDQLTKVQLSNLREVRTVIKDQATDEQILSMLNDHEQDPKQVIRHILEHGPDDSWSDPIGSKSKAKLRREQGDEADARRGKGAGSKGGSSAKPEHTTAGRGGNTRPQPKSANNGNVKLPTPAASAQPHPPAPTAVPAPQPAASNGSWAALAARGAPEEQLAPVADNSEPGWGSSDAPVSMTGPPLFESMMEAERQAQARGGHQSGHQSGHQFNNMANSMLPILQQQQQQQQQQQTPLPMPVPKPPVAEQQEPVKLESQVSSHSPPLAHSETCKAMSHTSMFHQNILYLWDNRQLCDLRLIPHEENKPDELCIRVHSAVIAGASSEIQKILLSCHQDNGQLPPDLVVHAEPHALEEMVRFMYTGELRINDDNVSHIMHAAETLAVPTAMELCVEFLGRNITSVTALSVSDLASRFNRPELKQAVEGYLLQNLQRLVQEPDFLQQPIERVKELLSSDDANFENEVDVFRAVVRWVRHDASRSACFANLLADTTRLPLMTPEQLLDEVEGEELVQLDPAARNLVFETYRYQALPEPRRDTMEIRCSQRMRRPQMQYQQPFNF